MKLPNKYNLKNSIELAEHLKNVHVNKNTKLFSFDISNMYTNIPVNETVSIITNKESNENYILNS